ncbi:hypothetical protein EVAR_37017_1 [Eumeta japonica]|uniref:Uncharacterized protein n=1 Tax=Eumeta variegata TaxID=151549 RepID=A0A4C1WZF9_EUMVA|nr:hypothetical protein EVAR_37017_1 [Eumeta japonica]
MPGQAPRRLQHGRRVARRTLQRPVSAGGGRTSALCTSEVAAVPSRLHFIANDAQAGPGRSARSAARVFGNTQARRTACVRPRGRRARPQRLVPEVFAMIFKGDLMVLVSWSPIPLRHAEACAVGRCRDRRPTRARGHAQAPAGGGLRRRLVLDEGREAQLKLDTQPTAGGRTLVDADRIKAARIGDPRWRRSDRARLPTADQAIHASDGSSQGSTCQRAVSFNLLSL